MKIVIAGAGEVGTHLAKMLTNENHDIVLLDEDEEKLNQLSSSLDLLTVVGSATSFVDLKEAGILNTDLYIAVTPYEDRNLLSCQIAKDLGASKTIARIDNQEYLFPKHKDKFVRMGVDELIYPEHLAATEVVEYLQSSSTRQLHEFYGGKMVLFGVKIRENSSMTGKSFVQLAKEFGEFRAVAITRNSKTIIPSGDDIIQLNDLVFFICKSDITQTIISAAGERSYDIKNIMVLGGSRIGVKTGLRLGDQFDVKLIEIDRKKSRVIADKLDKALVINADGRQLDILKDEGIDKVDAFVAVTGHAETNILACQMARNMGVKKTIAEVENMDYIHLAENLGIGGVINKKRIAASYIFRFTINAEMTHVKCLTMTDAEVFEFIAKEKSKITSNKISNLKLPEGISIGGIYRNGEVYIANGSTKVEAGDKVVVFAVPSSINKLSKFFK